MNLIVMLSAIRKCEYILPYWWHLPQVLPSQLQSTDFLGHILIIHILQINDTLKLLAALKGF